MLPSSNILVTPLVCSWARSFLQVQVPCSSRVFNISIILTPQILSKTKNYLSVDFLGPLCLPLIKGVKCFLLLGKKNPDPKPHLTCLSRLPKLILLNSSEWFFLLFSCPFTTAFLVTTVSTGPNTPTRLPNSLLPKEISPFWSLWPATVFFPYCDICECPGNQQVGLCLMTVSDSSQLIPSPDVHD